MAYAIARVAHRYSVACDDKNSEAIIIPIREILKNRTKSAKADFLSDSADFMIFGKKKKGENTITTKGINPSSPKSAATSRNML